MKIAWSKRIRVPRAAMAVGVLFGLSLVVWACYPGEITSNAQTDITATRYTVSWPWGTDTKYVLPDTVVQLRDTTDASDTLNIGRDCDSEILSLVASNMDNYGWTRIDWDTMPGAVNPDTPDVAILVETTMAQNWVVWGGYYPGWGWWGGWGGWGGWYPGWGYPCCYSGGVSSYTTGTMFMDMVGPPEAGDTIYRVPWTAAMNGVLSGTSGSCTRVTRAIDQAFTQSAYLQVAPANLPATDISGTSH